MTQFDQERYKQLLVDGQTRQLIEELMAFSKANGKREANRKLVMILAQYSGLQTAKQSGTIKDDDMRLETNKINDSLLEIIDELGRPTPVLQTRSFRGVLIALVLLVVAFGGLKWRQAQSKKRTSAQKEQREVVDRADKDLSPKIQQPPIKDKTPSKPAGADQETKKPVVKEEDKFETKETKKPAVEPEKTPAISHSFAIRGTMAIARVEIDGEEPVFTLRDKHFVEFDLTEGPHTVKVYDSNKKVVFSKKITFRGEHKTLVINTADQYYLQ